VVGFLQQTLERDDRPVRKDTWRLQIGVVGPNARGETVQNNFHDLIGVAHANGWDNQLRDELAFDVTAERKWQVPLEDLGGGLAVDVVPYAAASLGTVHTYGAGGALLRLGCNLIVDFGPPRILPGAPGSVTTRRGASPA